MKKRIIGSNWFTHLCFATALMLFSGCKPYYIVSDFENRTANHKTVAVLPFEMIFSGVKPERLTDAELETIKDAESKAFMISFYNEMLQSTRGGKKPIRVDVQHYDKTLKLLNDNGINVRSSWSEDPSAMAKILGVDAVVKARVEKHRLMSDLASYGIDLGVHIINILSDYSFWLWLPPGLTKSKEVNSSYSLIDKDGITLWSISYSEEADWHKASNEIIDHINRGSAKKFPYRSSGKAQQSVLDERAYAK